jgi:hypothetical protein
LQYLRRWNRFLMAILHYLMDSDTGRATDCHIR